MTSTEELINQLSKDLTPTPKLRPLAQLFGFWLVASLLYVFGLSAVMGSFRPGFISDLALDPFWLLEVIAGIAIVCLVGWAALASAMPGLRHQTFLRIAGIATLVWLMGVGVDWLPVHHLREGLTVADPMLGKRPHCIWETLLLTALPMTATIVMQQRRYPADKIKSVALAGISSAVLATWTMQMACMHHTEHSLSFHLAPALGVVVAAIVIALVIQRD